MSGASLRVVVRRGAAVCALVGAGCTSLHNTLTAPADVWIDATAWDSMVSENVGRGYVPHLSVSRTAGGPRIDGGGAWPGDRMADERESIVLTRDGGVFDTPGIRVDAGSGGFPGSVPWGTY